jgi:hypothetical protein
MCLAPFLFLAACSSTASPPLALHRENPHLFQFRGRPAVLVTSGEHYGAVLNLDFDFQPYLDELARCGCNLTRTFSGTYREVSGSFKIRDNTLAPRPGRFSCPWAARGGKYDLDRFDDGYFRRLHQFVTEAGRRGIAVEYVLFCPLYEDELWGASPMNFKNNLSGVGHIPRTEVLTLKHADLLDRQLAFVRRAVWELNEFDNVYFEICNEPYFGGVTREWQHSVADEIVATERGLPNRHLIAQNIANGKAEIRDPHLAVSIFNFHYASPPDAVPMNWKLGKPIGFDETGFQGTGDRVYRRQAWEFLFAGGAVFSNLDYSFTVEHEDGMAKVEDPTPGGGGPMLRDQLGILKRFIDSFDLVGTQPTEALVALAEPPRLRGEIRAIADRRHGDYAIYVPRGPKATFGLHLPPGPYHVRWIDPRDGRTLKQEDVEARRHVDQASGGDRGVSEPLLGASERLDPGQFKGVVIIAPEYLEDIAVRITLRPEAR